LKRDEPPSNVAINFNTCAAEPWRAAVLAQVAHSLLAPVGASAAAADRDRKKKQPA
jgi:hypothetical protein